MKHGEDSSSHADMVCDKGMSGNECPSRVTLVTLI